MRIVASEAGMEAIALTFKDGKLVEFKSKYFTRELFDEFFEKEHGDYAYCAPGTPENALYVLKHVFLFSSVEIDEPLPKFPYEEGAIY